MRSPLAAVLTVALGVSGLPTIDWSAALAVLDDAIANQTFPGCAAGVMGPDGSVLLRVGRGSQVYPGQTAPLGGNANVTTDGTLWDMASLTKIMGATTATAALFEAGLIDLRMPVSDPSLLGPAFAGQGKATIRVEDLLLHQAGFPPDPEPGFSTPAFGCPSATAPLPNLTYSCSERIFAAVLAQTLAYPPRTAWVYSDLSMITQMYVLGAVVAAHGLVRPRDLRADCAGADPAQRGLYLACHFEAFVRVGIHAPLRLRATQFLPPRADWPRAQPTWDDPTWRKVTLQGQVSDENAYALGGIAGHAGIFTTLDDALYFLGAWAYGARGGYPGLVSPPTRELFTTPPNATFSPRALGWLAQAPTDTYLGCGTAVSPQTWYHTGYTGTLLCADPNTSVSFALLTDRVYPASDGNADAIHAVRQAFGDAVVAALVKAGVITAA